MSDITIFISIPFLL